MIKSIQRVLERTVLGLYRKIGRTSGGVDLEWKGIRITGSSSSVTRIIAALDLIDATSPNYAQVVRSNIEVVVCMNGVRTTNFAATRACAIDGTALGRMDVSQLAILIVQAAAYNGYYRQKQFLLPKLFFRSEDVRARKQASEVSVRFAQELI